MFTETELPLPLRQIESAEHRHQPRCLQRSRRLAEQQPADQQGQRRHGRREDGGAGDAEGAQATIVQGAVDPNDKDLVVTVQSQ